MNSDIVNNAFVLAVYKKLKKELDEQHNKIIEEVLNESYKLYAEYAPPGPSGPPGDSGRNGIDGKDGKDGRDGIQGPEGKDGRDGEDGLPGPEGKAGRDGVDGKDGKDGLPGPEGSPGRDGKDGRDGEDGLPGRDGIDGKDGEAGKDGLPGTDGKDGKDGLNGRDGIDGKDGPPGPPGKDGRDGVDGKDGLPGKDGKDGVDGKDADLTPHLKNLDDWKRQIVKSIGSLGTGAGSGSYKIMDNSDVVFKKRHEIEGNAILIFDAEKKKFVSESLESVLSRIKVEIEMQYDKLIDVEGSYTYIGEAAPGSAKTSPSWRIKRVIEIGDDLEIVWANGSSEFNKVWDDRTSYTY